MKRNCYCELWKTNPETLKDQGLSEGYCGTCERCGKPGHTSHHPGPVPYTGSWCDRCYQIVAWTWPLLNPVVWIVLIGLVWIIVSAILRASK